MNNKQNITMRLQISVEANIEAESETMAKAQLTDRLEGMLITDNDGKWDCTLSDVSQGVSPLSAKTIAQIGVSTKSELINTIINQTALLSALSQMIWREVDKYDNEGLDDIGELLRPYHPDSTVSGKGK